MVVACITFISPVSSSIVAPAVSTVARQFDITNELEAQLIMSIFLLAYAVGPLFMGPLSEMYGRIIVLQLSNLFYLAFNTACGVARNKVQMIVFRFLAGIGGSAPLAVCPLPSFFLFPVSNLLDWRCDPGRLFPFRRTRPGRGHLQSRTIPWAGSRTSRGQFHYGPRKVALDVLCHQHRRRSIASGRTIPLAGRDICTDPVEEEGAQAA